MENQEQRSRRMEFARFILEHNQTLIGLADTKASIVLGIDGIVLALLFGDNSLPSNMGLKILTALLLALSAVSAFLTIKPRTIEGTPASNIFFGTIRKKTREAYVSDFRSINDEAILDDCTNNIYTLATIEAAKFHYLKISLYLLMLAFVPLGLMLLQSNWAILIGTYKEPTNSTHTSISKSLLGIRLLRSHWSSGILQ